MTHWFVRLMVTFITFLNVKKVYLFDSIINEEVVFREQNIKNIQRDDVSYRF